MLNECEIVEQAIPVLEMLLKSVPFIKEFEFSIEPVLANGCRADFIANITVGHDDFKLIAEAKKNLQPRWVHDVIRQVKECCSYSVGDPAYPLVVSEYISPRTAALLIEQNVSYFDLLGNSHLCFANVYIEKSGEKPTSSDKRGVKSLFGTKSSRMLRLMLNGSAEPWQVKALSAQSGLSYGQVSNIRRALLEQEYAIEATGGGIQLIQPDALLNDWQKLYKKNTVNSENGFYSLLNFDDMQVAIKTAIKNAEQQGALVMLSGLSSARWIAPFTRTSTESFYADKLGTKILIKQLMLEKVSSGANVIIEEPKDLFIFEEAIDCAPGLRCSSIIQTYLDLYSAGGRVQEAAEHIKSHVLKGKWSNT